MYFTIIYPYLLFSQKDEEMSDVMSAVSTSVNKVFSFASSVSIISNYRVFLGVKTV